MYILINNTEKLIYLLNFNTRYNIMSSLKMNNLFIIVIIIIPLALFHQFGAGNFRR